MFEKLSNFFNKMTKPEIKELGSKDAAKERLHLVLMQDRANVSVDFLELMKQEIIDVIKKYIVVDENAIDVRLTTQENEDGTNGAPSLYANIPILNIKNDVKAEKIKDGTLVYENGELGKVEPKAEEISLPTIELPENSEELSKSPETEENFEKEIIFENEEEATTSVTAENLENTENIEEVEEKVEQTEENVSETLEYEDDEDDEDVTFDELLKKAEEEEAMMQDEEKNEKKPSKNKKSGKQRKNK